MIVELCEHGEAKPHTALSGFDGVPAQRCPGGRVLEEAIIIQRDGATQVGFCKTHGSIQKNPHEKTHCEFAIGARSNRYLAQCDLAQMFLVPLDALASAQEER